MKKKFKQLRKHGSKRAVIHRSLLMGVSVTALFLASPLMAQDVGGDTDGCSRRVLWSIVCTDCRELAETCLVSF